jgi:hypothetical protein
MWVGTAATSVSDAWYAAHDIARAPGFGRCQPASDNEYDGTCAPAEAEVPLSNTPMLVSLPWSDFTGGRPEGTPNAEEITGFGFYVTWGGDSDTPYEMDITLDDLSFME